MRDASSLAEGASWDAGVEAFARYAESAAGRLRLRLTIETLRGHLRPPPLRVLDIGCGLGELAVWLAGRGDRVVALDPSAAMVEQAGRRAAGLLPPARRRLQFCIQSLEGAAAQFAPLAFDLVIAHTLLDYLTDPDRALGQILELVCEGGLLSVVRVNRISEALRPAFSGRLERARERLHDNRLESALFGVRGAATTPEALCADLERAGARVVGAYGMRVVADYLPAGVRDDPANWDALLALELALCQQPSCWGMGRYIHMVARPGFEEENP